jgi:hypothetical protein
MTRNETTGRKDNVSHLSRDLKNTTVFRVISPGVFRQYQCSDHRTTVDGFGVNADAAKNLVCVTILLLRVF